MPVIPIGNSSCYYRSKVSPAVRCSCCHIRSVSTMACGTRRRRICCRTTRCCATTREGTGHRVFAAGDYSIAELAQDVLALADACGVARFAFCGLSLGGMIGQWLGAHAPDRLTHLVLANTSSRLDRSAADGGAPPRRPRARHGSGRGAGDGPVLLAGRARLGVAGGGDRARDAPCDQSRRLRGLLRGGPGHESDRARRSHHGSDARHQR